MPGRNLEIGGMNDFNWRGKRRMGNLGDSLRKTPYKAEDDAGMMMQMCG